MCAKVAIIMTTYNRPETCKESFKSLIDSIKEEEHEINTVVYDDGSDKEIEWDEYKPNDYIYFSKNKGLVAIMNFILRQLKYNPHYQYDYICYVQDDVAFKKGWLSECIKVWESKQRMIKIGFVTCHDAPEHAVIGQQVIAGIPCLIKDTIRATHMFASAKRWFEHGTIPELTPGIAAPKPGHGSLFDWWLVRDGPNSTIRKGEKCVVIPGRLAHIGYNQSNWGMWNHEIWFVKE